MAVAVTRGDPPQVFLAESDSVLARVVALKLIARADPDDFSDARRLTEIRDALLSERWGDALVLWMESTGEVVDAYPDESVWTLAALDAERAAMEIRMAPIFRDR